MSGGPISFVSAGSLVSRERVGLEVVSTVGSNGAIGDAYMQFHKPGIYATEFGISGNNEFAFGGFTDGNNIYRFLTEKNPDTFSTKTKTFNGIEAPYVMTRAERDRDGALSVMNWIPQEWRTNLQTRYYETNPGDITPQLQSAFGSGEDLYFPRGCYPISGRMVMSRLGQSIRGLNSNETTIFVRQGGDLSHDGYLQIRHSCSVQGIEVSFEQISTNQRSALINFPAAFDMVHATNSLLTDILISKAMRGFNAVCPVTDEPRSAGGATMNNIRCGALDCGLRIDGALDWVKSNIYESWCYGFSADDNLMKIYLDGGVAAADIMQCESVAFGTFMTFVGGMNFRAGVAGTCFGNIASLCLDTDCATLNMQAGKLGIGTLYSTKNGVIAAGLNRPELCQSFRVSGGQLGIGQANLDVNGPVEDATVSGGSMTIGSGFIRQHSSSCAWGRAVSGGRIVLGSAVEMTPHDGFTQTRTQPFVVEDVGGTVVNHATFPFRSGDSGSAAAFLNPVNPNSRCDPQFGGWSILAPGGATKAQYGVGA